MYMVKKICFGMFLFFCLILNIVIDFNIKNYFLILEKCFEKNIYLTNNLYAVILAAVGITSFVDCPMFT